MADVNRKYVIPNVATQNVDTFTIEESNQYGRIEYSITYDKYSFKFDSDDAPKNSQLVGIMYLGNFFYMIGTMHPWYDKCMSITWYESSDFDYTKKSKSDDFLILYWNVEGKMFTSVALIKNGNLYTLPSTPDKSNMKYDFFNMGELVTVFPKMYGTYATGLFIALIATNTNPLITEADPSELLGRDVKIAEHKCYPIPELQFKQSPPMAIAYYGAKQKEANWELESIINLSTGIKIAYIQILSERLLFVATRDVGLIWDLETINVARKAGSISNIPPKFVLPMHISGNHRKPLLLGDKLIIASNSNTIIIWQLTDSTDSPSILYQFDDIYSLIKIELLNGYLITAGRGSDIRIWDITDEPSLKYTIPIEASNITDVIALPSGDIITTYHNRRRTYVMGLKFNSGLNLSTVKFNMDGHQYSLHGDFKLAFNQNLIFLTTHIGIMVWPIAENDKPPRFILHGHNVRKTVALVDGSIATIVRDRFRNTIHVAATIEGTDSEYKFANVPEYERDDPRDITAIGSRIYVSNLKGIATLHDVNSHFRVAEYKQLQASDNILTMHAGAAPVNWSLFGKLIYREDATAFKNLLDTRDIDINATNDGGDTLLHLAADSKEMAEILIDKGANVNTRNNAGETSLHQIITDTTSMDLLLKHGADINATDNEGNTPLHTILNRYNAEDELIYILIEEGANVNSMNAKGDTPLHIAARKQNLYFSKDLVKAGADIHIKNKNGQTAYDLIDLDNKSKFELLNPHTSSASSLSVVHDSNITVVPIEH
jgi:hypothetical protein